MQNLSEEADIESQLTVMEVMRGGGGSVRKPVAVLN